MNLPCENIGATIPKIKGVGDTASYTIISQDELQVNLFQKHLFLYHLNSQYDKRLFIEL